MTAKHTRDMLVEPNMLHQARLNVAKRYPEFVGTYPATGEPITGIVHHAIKRGDWDNGSLVQNERARLEAKRGR